MSSETCGRVLVGSTMERVGFASQPTAAGVRALLATSRVLVPSLEGASFVEAWAGLRPGSPDGMPSIGFCERSGLMAATGHFRNGILMAPATARLIEALLGGGSPDLDPGPFRPGRLHGSDPPRVQ